MGLDEAFEWIGPVENPLEYFESATAVVSTSRREAWPVVPMEAGLVGVATVAFEVGGCAEMGALGLIRTVEFPDTAALAAAAMELHESPDTRTNLVRAIGEHVAQHQSPAVIGPRFLSMLDGLCEDRPR
jgi:glycosyltransferase involved in cell wall biosynthesis